MLVDVALCLLVCQGGLGWLLEQDLGAGTTRACFCDLRHGQDLHKQVGGHLNTWSPTTFVKKHDRNALFHALEWKSHRSRSTDAAFSEARAGGRGFGTWWMCLCVLYAHFLACDTPDRLVGGQRECACLRGVSKGPAQSRTPHVGWHVSAGDTSASSTRVSEDHSGHPGTSGSCHFVPRMRRGWGAMT